MLPFFVKEYKCDPSKPGLSHINIFIRAEQRQVGVAGVAAMISAGLDAPLKR